MVGEYLQDLHVLGNLLPALDLLVEVFLAQALDRCEVSAELMLRYAHLSEGALAQLVPNSVEVCRGRHRLAHLLEVSDDHGDQILFVFEKGVKYLSNLDL